MTWKKETWTNNVTKANEAHLKNIEEGIEEAKFAKAAINITEPPYNAKGDGKTDATAAINAAIAALPKEAGGFNGGLLFAPPGAYLHNGTINMNKLTGVRIIGANGLCGAGAIGVGGPNAATVFIHEGTTRSWDMRASVGCALENVMCVARGTGMAGPIIDLEGLSASETGEGAHFYNVVIESGRELAGGKLIVPGIGVNLDKTNGCHFDHCIFSGNLYGVKGRGVSTNESVEHRFDSCFFAGSQTLHVVNPDDSWGFYDCIAEALFTNNGVNKKEPGFIGFSEAAYKARGLTLCNCWSSSNVAASTAEQKGTNITFRGTGLNIIGGEIACGESGIFYPEGPAGCNVTGVRFTKLINAHAIAGKSKQSLIAFNTYTECTHEIEDTVKERSGCMFQLGGGPNIGKIIEPGAFKKGAQGFETEAEAKAIREELAKVVKALQGAGLCE